MLELSIPADLSSAQTIELAPTSYWTSLLTIAEAQGLALMFREATDLPEITAEQIRDEEKAGKMKQKEKFGKTLTFG